jgi:hypothetical protein
MNLSSLHFRNSSLAASVMAKCSCNTELNKIKCLVFNSHSEEDYMSNDSDIEYTHDLTRIQLITSSGSEESGQSG